VNDQTYIIILRILHIGFGIFWAGSAIFFALFIMPALKVTGPDGMKFMQALGRSGYPIAAMISALITIVAGFLLIWKLSGGFQPEWFHSWYARTLTIGATRALIAFIIGFTINRPAAARINKISAAIGAQGGAPTPEQVSELMALRKRIFTATNYIAILLAVAVIGMSIFRYVG
jgi:hypothetical protein